MIELTLDIPPAYLLHIRELMGRFAEEMETGDLPRQHECPADDEEMVEILNEELRGQLASDWDCLKALFDESPLEQSVIRIDEDRAEGIIRSTSALRFKIRQTYLKEISDEALESVIRPPVKPKDQETAEGWMLYGFFAALQELVIEHIMPPDERT